MKILRWVLVTCLILGASPLRSAAQDSDSSRARNYQNCLYGFYGCDQARLTAEERPAVTRAAHSRNYQNCLNGFYGCDQAQLTAEERPAVTRAAHSRNYQNCLYGFYGCDRAQLTAEEREHAVSSPSDVAPSSAASTIIPSETLTTTGPACAENGSCYGDISERTGRPKTVHVQGYYRKDGTYVRGHYRSAPRR